MPLKTVSVKFREYQEFNYLGKPGNAAFESSNKEFPFLGYRAYRDEALPMIEQFSIEEFTFTNEIGNEEDRDRIRSYYNIKNFNFYMNDNIKENRSKLEEIWSFFRTTTHFATYYRCIPYLLPDYENSDFIIKKYIYIFRKQKHSSFPTIFDEFYVENDKYYQAHKSVHLNEKNEVEYYYYEEDRDYCQTGIDSISLTLQEENIEYDYLFVLSKIKLSVKRIDLLLQEMKNGTCNRAKEISIIQSSDHFDRINEEAIENIEREIAISKNEFLEKSNKLFSHFPSISEPMKNIFIPFMEKVKPIPSFGFSDILYNDSNNTDVNHVIFLIDYLDCTINFKSDFDSAVVEYDKFLNEKENGFPKSELKLLNDFISGIIPVTVNDSKKVQDFKNSLKDKMREKNGIYEFKSWNDDYTSTAEKLKKTIEIAGLYLAASMDTEEFCSLQYDYHFLKMKNNKSDSEEDIIDSLIDLTGELVLSLMQTKAGILFLTKLSNTARTHLLEIDENSGQKPNIITLYENYASSNDWFTPIFTFSFRKICTGFGSVFSAYISTLPDIQLVEIEKLLAKQTIYIKKRNSSNGRRNMQNSAMNQANNFGTNVMTKSGGYKTIRQRGRTVTVEIHTLEINTVKVNQGAFKTAKALDMVGFGLEFYNMYSAYRELNKIGSFSYFSVEYIAYTGAIFDTTTSLMGLAMNMSMKNVQVINIISSTFDYFYSAGSSFNAIENNDYDAAVYNGIAAVASLGSIAAAMFVVGSFISVGATIGTTGGAIGGAGIGAVPGAIAGIIVGTICGVISSIFSTVAARTKDNNYELWFNHCYWGKKYGSGKGHILNVVEPFNQWNNAQTGLSAQFLGFYSIFYNYSAQLHYVSINDITSIGVEITPSVLDNI